MNLPVVLAEPHPVARAALTALLAQDGRLDVFRLSELGDALGGRTLWLATADRLPPGDRARLGGHASARAASGGPPTIVMGLEDDSAFALNARRIGGRRVCREGPRRSELRTEIDALLADPALSMSLPVSA
jgi:hypothetical protein